MWGLCVLEVFVIIEPYPSSILLYSVERTEFFVVAMRHMKYMENSLLGLLKPLVDES